MNIPTVVVGIFYIKKEIYAMEDTLVILRDRQAVTTSLNVASQFKKQHKHVMESIRKLGVENSTVKNMFAESTYIDSQNHTRPMYYMNRDGFALLAMGFTGKEALKFKLKYIKAFNQMEEELKNQKLESPNQNDISQLNNIRVNKMLEILLKQTETNNIQAKNNNQLNNDNSNNEEIPSYYIDEEIPLGRFVKIFSKRHRVHLTRNRLFRYLRNRNILHYKQYTKGTKKHKKYNAPNSKYVHRGYFSLGNVKKENFNYKVTFATLTGQEWLDQVLTSDMDKLMAPSK